MNPPEDRSGLIKVVTSPLGFFALSLLIVEGFLTTVLVFSGLSPNQKFWGMIIGAFLFLVVVGGVWWLVKEHPKKLTFGEKGYLEEGKIIYGSNINPEDKPILEKGQSPTS